MEYKLAQNSWFGNEPVSISLPDAWDVEYLGNVGDSLPVLTREQIREKFCSAVGTAPIRELAKGHSQVVIVFDDLTRATPAQPIAEILLEELHAAGIEKGNIRFICGLGAHGALSSADFARKLGRDIVREYPVYNHNPYSNCVEVGTLSTGIKVALNKEFMECDLKIGIGGLVPHPLNGYGGGGKIVMPGVAAIETIRDTHSVASDLTQKAGLNPLSGSGSLVNDAFRKQIEEIVRMCHFDFKIDALLNTRSEMFDLFMGDPIEEYYAGAARAQGLYSVQLSGQKDVVIANANAKASEAAIAYFTGMMALKSEGGDMVLVDHCPTGQAVHYLCGPFGLGMGGDIWNGVHGLPPMVRRLIIYSPYPDYTSASWFCTPEQVIWAETWEEVEKALADHGPGTKAAVFADATLQHIVRS